MSFVNLLGNDRWSEADIKNRLQSIIRSEFSENAETELNRALQGHALGLHALSEQEQKAIAAFAAHTNAVTSLGVVVRAQATLLNAVLDFEQGLGPRDAAGSLLPLVGPALDLWSARHPPDLASSSVKEGGQ